MGTSAMVTAVMECADSGSPQGASVPAESTYEGRAEHSDGVGWTISATPISAYTEERHPHRTLTLAGDGTQFTNIHAYPVCDPTRAALVTGQDPHRVGLGSMEGRTRPGVPTTAPGIPGCLEEEFTGIDQTLSGADNATYQVGKWHSGGRSRPDAARSRLRSELHHVRGGSLPLRRRLADHARRQRRRWQGALRTKRTASWPPA